MNKSALGVTLALVIGVAGGMAVSRFVPDVRASGETGALADAPAEQPIFYRNPMNPAITSPVPAKDEMGMDYIPVYAEKPAAEKKPLFYRNPMNPAITSPVPAKDEMGMDYIPVYADSEADKGEKSPAGSVAIDPVVVQNIGVRTVEVSERELARKLRASGRIVADESRMARLHPRTEGWIEKQYISRLGEPVHKGDRLLEIYSPQLVASQQEYLLALDNLSALSESAFADIRHGARELAESAYQRLHLLGVPEAEIEALKTRREPVRSVSIESPVEGVVLRIGAREGQHVQPGTELYMLADLSRVWILADVYEYELPWVRVGDTATARLTGLEDREFTGTVAHVYPYAEPGTRTVKVRIEFDNPDGLLRPDMFASVTIDAQARKKAVAIPAEAIVRSGAREQVFVVRGEGKYEPRDVTLGLSSDGWVEVRAGLKAGERVVSSALFLIDSESKLREATAKMMAAAQTGSGPEPGMNDMSMDGMGMDSMSMDGMDMDDLSMDDLSMGTAP